jgi:membrane protein required for beta-lactamase induction
MSLIPWEGIQIICILGIRYQGCVVQNMIFTNLALNFKLVVNQLDLTEGDAKTDLNSFRTSAQTFFDKFLILLR